MLLSQEAIQSGVRLLSSEPMLEAKMAEPKAQLAKASLTCPPSGTSMAFAPKRRRTSPLGKRHRYPRGAGAQARSFWNLTTSLARPLEGTRQRVTGSG